MFSLLVCVLATYVACGVLVTALMVLSHLQGGGKPPTASDMPWLFKAVMSWPEQLLGWKKDK